MTRYWLLMVVVVALGCGRAGPYDSGEVREAAMATAQAVGVTRNMAAESGETSLPTEGSLQRKIIYTAEVDLVVERFDPIPDQVEALVKQFGGYVAGSTVSGSPGYPRTGDWTLRIPVDRYEAFLAAVRGLGEVHRVSVDSQDVTEEYYDVEARIGNKKKEEARLLELLENATGKLEDVLAVEKELSRVRGEIERVEGRLRVLNDQTSLTTVTLTVQEIKGYVPEETASYVTRVRRGFQGSIRALVATTKSLSIAVIVLLPWLPAVLVLWIVLRLLWRVRRRRQAPSG